MTSSFDPAPHSGMISGPNTLITGGIFQQTVTISHNLNRYDSLGLYSLSQSIAVGAIHDSAERYPPPRCEEGDHSEILDKILTWSEDPLSSGNTLWVSGSPTSEPSRSAIAQTVAETLADSNQLAGSFFFEKHNAKRGDCLYLFLTLAYQIAINVPGMRERINSAIYNDPTVLTKAAGVQLRSLIIKPFNDLTRTGTPSTFPSSTIIIDSLEECEAEFSQRDVLRFILTEASRSFYIPVRFIIFSEREPRIQQMFQDFNTYHSVRCLALDQGENAKITPLRVFKAPPLTVRPIPYGQTRTENAMLSSPKDVLGNDVVSGRPRSSTAPSYTFASRRAEITPPPSMKSSASSQGSPMNYSLISSSTHSRMDISPPVSLHSQMDCSPPLLPPSNLRVDIRSSTTIFTVPEDAATSTSRVSVPVTHRPVNEFSPPIIVYPRGQDSSDAFEIVQHGHITEPESEKDDNTTGGIGKGASKPSLLKTLRSHIGRPRSRSWGFQPSERC
ncbi:hypothetical protein D9619_009024 [Psilocybe cf. subviscida]|uniref:Nephrocystin 3-like N-terminal domain-containing protein n=1 Tax=Psilocybe cf. subviscida TaxID=2480587 RepID=A0A8H5BW07_9AGAR|nr:hypothetical protein D9619_009024 [Psilocybe cf. subviscida]